MVSKKDFATPSPKKDFATPSTISVPSLSLDSTSPHSPASNPTCHSPASERPRSPGNSARPTLFVSGRTRPGSASSGRLSVSAPLSARQGSARKHATPALAAAFNLRNFSERRERLASTCKGAQPATKQPLEHWDLVGGNGRWRQRKAVKEWAQRAADEKECRRIQQLQEEERRRQRAEVEARRRRQLEEDELRAREEGQRFLEEEEKLRRQDEELDERRRLARAATEREWLLRQPKTCDSCCGSGRCTACGGCGQFFATFLVATVPPPACESDLSYGRTMQGCTECGGHAQGIRGDFRKGNGRCATCNGIGKVASKHALAVAAVVSSNEFRPASASPAHPISAS